MLKQYAFISYKVTKIIFINGNILDSISVAYVFYDYSTCFFGNVSTGLLYFDIIKL